MKVTEEDMKTVVRKGISSHYLDSLKKGKIVPKPTEIEEVKENSVLFKNEDEVKI